jgi:hypothetical protein
VWSAIKLYNVKTRFFAQIQIIAPNDFYPIK